MRFWRFGWADEFFEKHVYPRVEGEKYTELNLDKVYTRPTSFTDAHIKTLAKAIVNLGDDFDMLEENEEIGKTMNDVIEAMDPDEYTRIFSAFGMLCGDCV